MQAFRGVSAAMRKQVKYRRGSAAGFWLRHASIALRSMTRSMQLPAELVWAREHDALLARQRFRFIETRLRVAALCLCVGTLGWIAVDWWLFHGAMDAIYPVALARIAAALLFFCVAVCPLPSKSPRQAVRAILGLAIVGVAFYAFVHWVLAATGNNHSAGHTQYLLFPIALAAGIAIFPLTLVEIGVVLTPLVVVMTMEFLHGDRGVELADLAIPLALMATIMLTSATCAVSQLKLLIDLHRRSAMDALTGLLTRRAGTELLEIVFAAARREDAPLALVFADLDRFKPINDCFGHEAGDRLLHAVASRLRGRLRHQGVLIRWGGEEFLMVLPNTEIAEATALMSALMETELAVRPDGARQTVSVGIAERRSDGATRWRTLVKAADARMYQAKQAGRNLIVARPETAGAPPLSTLAA